MHAELFQRSGYEKNNRDGHLAAWAAEVIGGIIAALGVLILLGGAGVFLSDILAFGSTGLPPIEITVATGVYGLLSTAFGVFLVLAGQVGRVVLNNCDNARRMLEIMQRG
jgi:hypothetical protein